MYGVHRVRPSRQDLVLCLCPPRKSGVSILFLFSFFLFLFWFFVDGGGGGWYATHRALLVTHCPLPCTSIRFVAQHSVRCATILFDSGDSPLLCVCVFPGNPRRRQTATSSFRPPASVLNIRIASFASPSATAYPQPGRIDVLAMISWLHCCWCTRGLQEIFKA